MLDLLAGALIALAWAMLVLAVLRRVSLVAYFLVAGVDQVFYASVRLAQGAPVQAAIASTVGAVLLYLWWRGGGGRGGWRRFKRWARSHLPRPAVVRLRPGLGAA